MPAPEFLNREIVEQLHDESLARFGGRRGIRDRGLVDSALGAAVNTYYYGGEDLYETAAAYAFHIAQAQAFLDGNKRTAVAAALVFLTGNGEPEIVDDGSIYDAMIAIANKTLGKRDLAQVLRRLSKQ